MKWKNYGIMVWYIMDLRKMQVKVYSQKSYDKFTSDAGEDITILDLKKEDNKK